MKFVRYLSVQNVRSDLLRFITGIIISILFTRYLTPLFNAILLNKLIKLDQLSSATAKSKL